MNNNGPRPSQEIIEEGYKQARLNTRCKALDLVLVTYQSRGDGPKEVLTASDMVKEAKLLEEYMLEGIQPPQQSSIIKATTGPH